MQHRASFTVLLGWLLCTGCSSGLLWELLNNSQETVIISLADETVTIEPGQRKSLKLPKKGDAILVHGRTTCRAFVFEDPGQQHRKSNISYAALNGDGRIVSLRMTDKRELVEVSEQPMGYPLVGTQR